MAPKLYLPLGKRTIGDPKDERQELMNRAYDAQYLIPGAEELEISQLRDLVQYAEYRKAQQDAELEAQAIEKITRMSKEQQAGMINEYEKWRRKRQIAKGLIAG